MSEIRAIPKHWQLKQLGKVCDKISLNGIKIKQKDYLQEGKFPVVDQGQEMIGGYFNDEKLVVPTEPPYIVFGDHTKVKKYINFKFIAGADGVKVLKPHSIYDPKFFFYLIHTVKIPDKGYARHFQFLEKEQIPVPPLPEQQAIVAKTEELLSDLENGKQQLQTAQQQLKVYRQSLLKWAFEGKLTNKNVKDGELPKGWKLVTVDEIGKVKGGKRLPKGDAYSEEPTKYPYLRVTDFENQTINQKKLKFLTASTQAQIKNYIISKADVFISIAGTIGTTGTIPENLDGANLTENAAKITDLKNIYNKYLSQFLASMEGQSQIKEYTKTTTQPKLSLFRIEKIELPLPPLEEQQRIVAELESKLTVCDKIEETISQSLQQAETLRQSILKQAFEGKLIQTEVFTGKKKELV
jgi:type I restriction enzyme S subunit